jgi:NAD(P)-dependent dehydrogenase (short-subunit alcohol dehydrogenase family)
MKSFAGKIAVITGGGSGMGRELALQLAAMGCDVAICDVFAETMGETKRLCLSQARQGTRVAPSWPMCRSRIRCWHSPTR